MSTEPLSLLTQREIEARIVGPLVAAFAAEFGAERTQALVAQVVQDLARHSGCLAAQSVGGTDLPALHAATQRWRAGGALELTVLRADDAALEFDVTRCRYAEMYQRLGLAELGAILSCGRDAAMVAGFNPQIEFSRTQTLLGGASHCNFRYRLATTAAEKSTP
jgi:hypothetical protein